MKRAILSLVLFGLLKVDGFSKTDPVADTVQIESTKTKIVYKAVVVKPEAYDQGSDRFPTLYLLHGGYGKYTDWTEQISDKTLIQRMSDQYSVIIVMPEGEQFSYYLDSPVDPKSQFESYISQDVIGFIDSHYRTIAKKEGRAITGLSMGGYGALYISANHPDMFAAAGSMSGAINPDMKAWKLPQEISKNVEDAFAGILGDKIEFPERYESASILSKIDQYKKHGISLIIDCGVDDFLIEANRELHRRLDFENISHDYSERDGGHSWEYWENAFPYHMLFFSKILGK